MNTTSFPPKPDAARAAAAQQARPIRPGIRRPAPTLTPDTMPPATPATSFRVQLRPEDTRPARVTISIDGQTPQWEDLAALGRRLVQTFDLEAPNRPVCLDPDVTDSYP